MWIVPKNIKTQYQYAVDTEGLNLASVLQDCDIEQSLMWRSKPSLLRTWSQRWKRVYWFRLLCGRILRPSQWKNFEDEYTVSLPVIHANRLVLPDSGKGQTTQDTYGLTLDEYTKQYNLTGCFSRTLKDTLRLDSPQLSAIWKKMVIELRQDCLRRQKLALHTEEKECLSWPTPREAMSRDKREDSGRMKLGEFVYSHPGQEVHNMNGKNRGSLNPRWVEQLMGLSRGWTSLGYWATELFQSKLNELGKF